MRAWGAQNKPGAAAAAAARSPGTILVLGDSLSAEYGLPRGSGWVALLEKKLAAEKIAARVVNASISGDTTSGGRSRLPALLAQHKPSHVVIELGGNDALRGLPLKNTEENLTVMTQAAQKAGAKVLLVGMQVPPNMGKSYTTQFKEVFGRLAQKNNASFVPFLLEGVGGVRELNQGDGIHPTAEGQKILAANVWKVLEGML